MRQIVQVSQQLDQYRLVEAEAGAELGESFFGDPAGFARQNIGGIAGDELEQEKNQDDDADDGRNRLEQRPD